MSSLHARRSIRVLIATASLFLCLNSASSPAQPAAPSLAIHCAPKQSVVRWGTSVKILVSADNPDHRPLTFSYTVSFGKIVGRGIDVVFHWSSKDAQMQAEVTCRVADDLGHSAQQTFTIYSYNDSGGGGGGSAPKGKGKHPEASAPAGDGAAPPPPPPPPPPPDQPAIAAFPWPPPQASSRVLLAAWPRGPQMRFFGDIDGRLTAALQPQGYVERSYYSVPGGFALVTRLEQIYSDGRSMPPPARFSAQLLPPTRFSDYIRALFNADPGYYRVIVFIVTDQGFSEGSEGASQGQADSWIRDGVDMLPPQIASRQLTDGVRCAALIYEFRQSNASSAAKAELIPEIDAVINLSNAGLWQALK